MTADRPEPVAANVRLSLESRPGGACRASVTALVVLGALVTLAAGCGGGGGKRSIVLYNGQHPS